MPEELHLRVYANRSELVRDGGARDVFLEGSSTPQARKRYEKIVEGLEAGFLEKEIAYCRKHPELLDSPRIAHGYAATLAELVGSQTSEVGRALVGLAVLQLSIKALSPDQSVRLHKGGTSRRDFSWKEGVSMRSLDSNFITPALRKSGLLHLNRYGFMMTRALAENYPYSAVYKAQMRGGRAAWISIVEAVETRALPAREGLRHLLALLIARQQDTLSRAEATLAALGSFLVARGSKFSIDAVAQITLVHMVQSKHAARLMEIAMHSMMQALAETKVLGPLELRPLAQMRSANLKARNIADVELLAPDGAIVEGWDAKYGKPYLRDELEELTRKLGPHAKVDHVGFVTSEEPDESAEIEERRAEIERDYDVRIEIIEYTQWVLSQAKRAIKAGVKAHDVARCWLTAYVESLAQKRRKIAPIDEPSDTWLQLLEGILKGNEEL